MKIVKIKHLILSILISLSFLQVQAAETNTTESFIERFYTNILQRASDTAGINYWKTLINSNSAGFVALGFFNSNEFKAMNLTNEQYVKLLYTTMYGRTADTAGLNYWLNLLANDSTREHVLFSFLNAQEFKDLAQTYGVTSMPSGVKGYVMRFYSLVLGRVDESGLNYWSNQIETRTQTASQVATFFFQSEEYQAMNQNNATFVNTAYQAFFGRVADQGGKDYWDNQMNNGKSRLDVVNSFIASQEFQDLVNSFNLGTNQAPTANAGEDQTATKGVSVYLNGISSIDTDGTIVSYVWKEGETVLSTNVTFSKDDFVVGTHTITLTVKDDEGLSSSDTVTIVINENTNQVPLYAELSTASGVYIYNNLPQSELDTVYRNVGQAAQLSRYDSTVNFHCSDYNFTMPLPASTENGITSQAYMSSDMQRLCTEFTYSTGSHSIVMY